LERLSLSNCDPADGCVGERTFDRTIRLEREARLSGFDVARVTFATDAPELSRATRPRIALDLHAPHGYERRTRAMHARTRLTLALVALATGSCGGGGGAANRTLYYSSTDDGFIYALSLASGDNHKLFSGNDPYRTAEGTFLYVNGSDLAESTDGVQVRTIIPFDPDIPRFDNGFHYPRPSPDGTLVAYSTNDHLVYVCRRDSGAIVSHFSEAVTTADGWDRPTWTRDGRIVVAGLFSNPGLYVSDAGFTTLTRFDPMVNHPTEPSVSPTADVVAFIANDHVFTVHLDGTGLQQLTDGNQSESLPDWSLDGTTIAAWQALHLITMSATGANPTRTDVTFPDTLYPFNVDQQFSLR
jgi:hypothetical protein